MNDIMTDNPTQPTINIFIIPEMSMITAIEPIWDLGFGKECVKVLVDVSAYIFGRHSNRCPVYREEEVVSLPLITK